jgi:acetylcholinesterase
MQSGGFLADWATLEKKTAIKRYTETLQHMGCNGTAPQLIECAKRLNPQHVLDSSDEYFFSRADHGIMQFPFLPVVDNYFLEGEPIELVNRGKVKKCPIMLGVNKDEANWFYIYAFPEYRDLKTEPKLTYDLYRTFLHSLFHYYPQFPTTANKKVIDAITYR